VDVGAWADGEAAEGRRPGWWLLVVGLGPSGAVVQREVREGRGGGCWWRVDGERRSTTVVAATVGLAEEEEVGAEAMVGWKMILLSIFQKPCRNI